MSVVEQVVKRGFDEGEKVPELVEELIRRLLDNGVRAGEVAIVKPILRSRDPVVYVRGEAVAAWLRME